MKILLDRLADWIITAIIVGVGIGCWLIVLVCVLSTMRARADAPAASVVVVDEIGGIRPAGAVASIELLSETTAAALAAAAEADAVSESAQMLSNEIARIEAEIAAQQSTGYIRGFVRSFEGGLPPNTNITSSIIQFDLTATDPTNSYYTLWTYYTEDPGTLPYVRYSTSLGAGTNAWEIAPMVGDPVLDDILVDGEIYETYKTTVAMPLEYADAFFRVYADVAEFVGDAEYLYVRNGISVDGETPLTATLTEGTTTLKIVGGVIVE